MAHEQRSEASVVTRSEDCDRVVQVLKAVAHPVRLKIIALLCDGDYNVTELSTRLDASQSVVSQQLRILRMNQLVDFTRKDGFAIYRLTEPHLVNLIKCVQACCAM